MKDLTDAERVKAIKKALTECGEKITPEVVKKQFRYETGYDYEVHRIPDPYETGE